MPERECVWDRPREVLTEHLDRIAEELDVYAETVGGCTTTAAQERTSRRPFFCESRFNELSVSVEFTREADTLRYASRLCRYRRVLAEGPTGVVDVHDGFAAASCDINRAMAAITRFVDGRKSLIRQGTGAQQIW